MTDTAHMPVAASAQIPSTRQRAFNRYSTAFLIYLVVLNLFAEFWDRLFVHSFSYSLVASLILLITLKATLVLEKHVAGFFSSRPGTMAKVMRYFSAWLILAGSKFVILAVGDFFLGDPVELYGRMDGMFVFIVIVVVMMVAEEVVVRFYQTLD
jgi:hypothetical protein